MSLKLIREALEEAPIKRLDETPDEFIEKYAHWYREFRHKALDLLKVIEQDVEVFGNSYVYDGQRLDPTKVVIMPNKGEKQVKDYSEVPMDTSEQISVRISMLQLAKDILEAKLACDQASETQVQPYTVEDVVQAANTLQAFALGKS